VAVLAEVKICGLTRPHDAALAIELGAAYLGAIFAGGPRLLTPERAREVLAPAEGGVARRVGVFAHADAEAIAHTRDVARLDVAQLHGDPTEAELEALRRDVEIELWAVVRVGDDGLPPDASSLFAIADAVVLDRRSARGLGGTGETFAWESVATTVASIRAGTRLVVAGGLGPENVARAIDLFAPDVVDVSSGIEDHPGIKNPDRMRAFVERARRLQTP
jgi:phosphoribosylanthranilate isomerase